MKPFKTENGFLKMTLVRRAGQMLLLQTINKKLFNYINDLE